MVRVCSRRREPTRITITSQTGALDGPRYIGESRLGESSRKLARPAAYTTSLRFVIGHLGGLAASAEREPSGSLQFDQADRSLEKVDS